MSASRPDTKTENDRQIRDRVLRAILLNRCAGLHFPGHFLDLAWRKSDPGSAWATLANGPHCRGAGGGVSMLALGLLADHILAAAVRTRIPTGARLGTTQLGLQFTREAPAGDIEASSRLFGQREGAVLPQSLASGVLAANGQPFCQLSGEFALLDPPAGVTLAPLPWERDAAAPPPPGTTATGELAAHEQAILRACDDALATAGAGGSFIERFWGGDPRTDGSRAENRVAIDPRIGNRVGHVQGGILLGLAAANACAAMPAGTMLSNISAWYVGPGRGERLGIVSTVVHSGRTTALVRTEIRNEDGERVVEAVSHHARRRPQR